MTLNDQWLLILGAMTVAITLALVPVAIRQAMTTNLPAARRYWIYAAAGFVLITFLNGLILVWLLAGHEPRVVTAMQLLCLLVVIALAVGCRVGYEFVRRITQMSDMLQENQASLRGYQRNLESLVERRTNALRAEVMRRRDAQDQLSRYIVDVEDDLRLASDLQNALLPETPELEFCQCHVILRPYSEVSGDTYNFSTERDILRVFLADAMGHGVAAALLTNMVHAGLHQIPVDAGGSETLGWLNDLLASHETDAFTTGVHLTIDESGRLEVASAGSPEILIHRAASGELEAVPGEGLPLGLLRRLPQPYVVNRLRVHAGDRIFAFTDGLYEWRNRSGQQWGVERLKASILESAGQDIASQSQWMCNQAREFAGGIDPGDDLSLIVVGFGSPDSAKS